MSVTARGGYQIVDLLNTPLTIGAQDPVTIKGIFEQAGNIGKNAIICNLTLVEGGSNVNYPPRPAVGASYQTDEDGNIIVVIFTIFAKNGIKYDLGIGMQDDVYISVSH